ncbi:MAG: hypothetical protein IPO88_25360 [Nannocystis sp.]|uniref:hypothetical protein n=1 Tax=Nannocystis sp. TaxID=1962667 RepID=UPI002425A703|nr:hypothetical protein [Nannocystis sp.]MBK9756766.1 hypothetical protein [Nannocystis sp.]
MTPPPRNRRRQHPANRRRPRPSATHGAARRHSRWLARQLQRAGLWLRALPARLRSTADTAGAGRLLRPWSEPAAPPSSADTGLQIVLDDDDATTPTGTLRTPAVPASAALGDPADSAATLTADSGNSPSPVVPRAPRPLQRASAFSKQIAPKALALGRELAPRAAQLGRQFGRQLGPLARRSAAATGQSLRATGRRLANLRPLLRLLGRFFAAIGAATLWLLGGLARGSTIVGDRLAGALARHQALLLALLTRALWWTALVLLFLGGRALVEIHERSPFLATALPSLLAGLALCAFLLLFASQARMRWAAFALGLGHGGLLALVWVVSAVA